MFAIKAGKEAIRFFWSKRPDDECVNYITEPAHKIVRCPAEYRVLEILHEEVSRMEKYASNYEVLTARSCRRTAAT